jgi:hypothetical protein
MVLRKQGQELNMSSKLVRILPCELLMPQRNLNIAAMHSQITAVKGAALRGLDHGKNAPSMVARYHYGLVENTPFKEGIDDEKHAFIHPVHGKKSYKGRMMWFIEKVTYLTINPS